MSVEKFDIVKCPFDEIGIVREIETQKLWGNRVLVEIIKTKGVFHKLGENAEYKPEDLKIVTKLQF